MSSTRQQNKDRHIEIVHFFCMELADDTQRTVCLLLSNNVPEKEICSRMGIASKRLRELKQQIAEGLRLASVRLYGKEVV